MAANGNGPYVTLTNQLFKMAAMQIIMHTSWSRMLTCGEFQHIFIHCMVIIVTAMPLQQVIKFAQYYIICTWLDTY